MFWNWKTDSRVSNKTVRNPDLVAHAGLKVIMALNLPLPPVCVDCRHAPDPAVYPLSYIPSPVLLLLFYLFVLETGLTL